MKKVIIFLILTLSCSSGIFALTIDQLTNLVSSGLNSVLTNALNPISLEMAKHMGFYTGSGNVTPVNTSGDFSINFGLGFGVNFSPIFFEMVSGQNVLTNASSNPMNNTFNNVGTAIGAVPFPYDDAYFKLGLPGLPMDLGLRLGLVPSTSISTGTGSTVSFGEFHIGAESRYLIWNLGDWIKADWRVSVDYDSGAINYSYSGASLAYTNGDNVNSVGTNNYTVSFGYQWGGISIGTKLMAGINIPYFGGPFLGVGLNMNLGSVSSSLSMNNTFTSSVAGIPGTVIFPTLSGTAPDSYNLFDIRLIGGFKILFINLAAEYGALDGDWDFSVYLAFNF